MYYQVPFVLILNISVCAIMLFLALPSLLNRKEELKIRLAFSLIFFTVIVNCTTNVLILLLENYHMVPVVFMAFFIPLLFGPAVYYYVKSLLGSKVGKAIYLSLVPGIICFAYGIYLIQADNTSKQLVLNEIIAGDHIFFNLTNILTLIYIIIYCAKSWLFLKRLQFNEKDKFFVQNKLKKAWAKEFIIYIFVPVFSFSIIHALVVSDSIGISTMEMDLIWMPVFMLVVYLLIAIRSMMMYKEFEHQLVLTRIESEKLIQDQRFSIARDLHDSLGAQLTFVNTMLDSIRESGTGLDEKTTRKISRLSEFSQNSITELKSVLWVLHANEIHLQDVKARLLNFVRDAGEANENIRFSFEFEYTQNRLLNSNQAVNLIRTIQEVVNNAIKHSGAREVFIHIKQFEESLELVLGDNGTGFDWEQEQNKSFGLLHIKERVAEIGGQLQVETAKTSGTVYKIKIPLQ